MSQNDEIKKCCHFRRRFATAYQNLIYRNEDKKTELNDIVHQCLVTLIDISKNPGQYRIFKSDAYLLHFKKENPSINFGGFNPFNILSLTNHFSIDLIYILKDECIINGVDKILLKGGDVTENHKVSIYHIFDDYNEQSFSPIKPGRSNRI